MISYRVRQQDLHTQ